MSEHDDDVRTQARERAEREFTDPHELPEAAEQARAEARLQETLERELGVPLGDSGSPAAARKPALFPTVRAESGIDDVVRWLLGAAWKPAIAVVLLVVGTWTYGVMLERKPAPAMRGSVTTTRDELVLAPPGMRPNGAVLLRWSPLAQAERYAVVFQSPDLVEIGRLTDLTGTTLELSARGLPEGLTPGGSVLCHVVALRGADELARSKTVAVTLPR